MYSKAKWTLTGRVPGHRAPPELEPLATWYRRRCAWTTGPWPYGVASICIHRAGRKSRFAIDVTAGWREDSKGVCLDGVKPTPNLVPWMSVAC